MFNFNLPKKSEINTVFYSFSKKERIVFIGLLVVLFLSTILILETINKSFMTTVPLRGGSLSIGVVGIPRFVNPILANSQADIDLSSLIYSGLMRKNGNNDLIPDLAEKYDMSKNGLTYTFILKDNIYFQDGNPITADDVLFTINKVKDSIIKSPHKMDWDGVIVEKIDEKTIRFTLKQPYASFLENATFGIMPSYIWNNSPAMEQNNANTNPIGSGPYMISSISKQSSGIIDNYKLVPFKKFALGEAYIANLNIYFYQNENELINALYDKSVDQISSITPLNAQNLNERNYKTEFAVLPRVFGLFFNQNVNRLFTDKVIVSAINQLIDKDKIVRDVLFGYGVTIDGPIPPNMSKYQEPTTPSNISRQDLLKKVQASLAKDGWKAGDDGFLQKTTTDKKKKVVTTLDFSISTGNVPELAKTAELIRQDLAEAGIKVEVKTFENGDLKENVIRPRKYDALLFGEIINHESDLFAFWHSSQRKDPGANVAMYTNAKVDKILEDAFITVDDNSRTKKYIQFEDMVKKDMPAVFLYSPDFLYIVSKDLKQFRVDNITSPSDRYQNVYSWYLKTENVWKIFTK